MKVYFAQVYIEQGAQFPFSTPFQRFLSQRVTDLVVPSRQCVTKYGDDFNLIFRVSAKKGLVDLDIRGPGVYRRDRDVEYTVFLPYDVIRRRANVYRSALQFLLQGVLTVFGKLGIDTAKVEEQRESIINEICDNPAMFGN